MLRNAKVAACIQTEMDGRSQRTGITTDRVLEEIARIAFSNLADYVDWSHGAISIKSSSGLNSAQTAAVSEIVETNTATGGTIKIKLHSKMTALELLGKHLKLFTDRQETTKGSDGDIFQALADAIARDPDTGIGPSRSRRALYS